MRFTPLCFLSVFAFTPLQLPHQLTDGSSPPEVPAPLAVHGQRFVMTRVTAANAGDGTRLATKCAREAIPPRTIVIERIGVRGRSITFPSRFSTIVGCDNSPRTRALHNPFCGASSWRLSKRKVSDPRLDVCYDSRNRQVIAFGWINPVRRARWIVVDQPGYREVYPVAAGLPVRVSTISGLRHAGSAVFRTTQYDSRGVLLVRRKVVASIAS